MQNGRFRLCNGGKLPVLNECVLFWQIGNPQSIELTEGAQVFLGQCFSYVEKAAQRQRTCHFALRVYLLRNNTKTKTCTTTLWGSKVDDCIPKIMIMMLYRIYKRLRPRQCRQFSNVHGYHSKSTFRVLIKQNYVILYLLFMVFG